MAGAGPGGTSIVFVVPGPTAAPLVVTQAVAPGIVVTEPAPHLPLAGFDVATAAVLAALLLALGVLLLVAVRRHLRAS